jgi:hypothetical protein
MAVAALVVPVSGPYTATFDDDDFGTLNDDGYILTATTQGQEINQSDAYGMTLVEAIYRGQNWKLRIRGLEWDQEGLINALLSFGTLEADFFKPWLDGIGERWSTQGETLILSAILGNPPTYPQSLTAMSCCLSPNSQSESMWTSKMREFPLEFVLLPYQATVSGMMYNIPFSTT